MADAEVAAVFARHPPAVRKQLEALKSAILATAAEHCLALAPTYHSRKKSTP